jgi:twitching motility protein PilT
MDFLTLAQYAQEHGASDIHLSPGLPPLIRIYGEMKEVRVAPFSAEDILAMLHSLMTDEQKTSYEKEWELDFSIAISEQFRYRINAYATMNGPSAAFRSIPVTIKSLAEIKAPPMFETFTHYNKGLVLVTGPTGSGKSTTLAALINHINVHQAKHVITIEDPIEFVHKSKKALINQREVGANTKSFARALKSALREDPDVILVGELRDLESISLALTAAETGHLVFATLHTSSAAKTIDRIVDVFPGDDKSMVRAMLAGSLNAVIAQRLLKRKDNSGRVAAYEIMITTGAIRNLIRENKIPQVQSLIQVGRKHGMVIMEDYVKDLLAQDVISVETAAEILEKEERDVKIAMKSEANLAHNVVEEMMTKKSEAGDFN